MKINITLEVAPNEVPLATELLAVLRQLTDHVAVTNTGEPAADTQSSATAAGVSPPQLQAAAGFSSTPQHSGDNHLQHVHSGPPPPAAAPAGPATVSAVAPQLEQQAVASAPAGLAMPFPRGTTPQQQMHALISACEFQENQEALAQQLEAVVMDPSLGGPAVLFPSFCSIWISLALNPNLPAEERSAVPFVTMLRFLGPQLQVRFRDYIMRHLVKHLTTARPLNANRGEYYVHAEAFAALVSIEIVPMEGAIKTMCTLAKTAEKRGAAVTMLGKTVELAGHMILEKVPRETQELMRSTVASIVDEDFRYDVEYINSSMGWAPGGGGDGGGAHAAPAAQLRQLVPVRSIAGYHTEPIFALAVDTAHQQFVTGGKDSYLQVWTQEGQPLQKLELGDQYISSLDFHPRLNMLLCSCVSHNTNNRLRLGGFISSQPNGFECKGFVTLAGTAAVATVRALPGTNGFLTGETVAAGQGQLAAPVIRYWDMAAASSFEGAQPTQVFTGHASIATALRGVAADAHTFASGDKDGSLLLWDLRAPQHVGTFGAADATGRVKAHATMVTSIESSGHLVISGSTDSSVALWDIRQMGQPPLAKAAAENMTVLKLALNNSQSTVAISAVSSMRLLDISNPTAPVLSEPVVAAWPDGQPRSIYHELKWNEPLGLLIAVGKDKLVDMFTLA
ncbi:hypothetical protein D9Q98_003654 [Chlorella vulgaris]|uniref:Guanine nucleotide-binding protein subunit beta-like protein n=1 Tax=Chlorella vulgaris TaxID=3077 RepID=A0A9D4TT25_CHLVU|nr:hypothetical protein D9Q98_003654 [Chlorella vulgaris]